MNTHAASSTHHLTRSAQWSAVLASACAVHCATTPFLAVALPVLAVSEGAEWWALLLTVVLGGSVTLMGPARTHIPVLGLLLIGAGIWTGSLLGAFEPLPEAVTSPIGSLIYAAGMLWSARVCRSGDCERCETDPGESA